MSGVENKIEIDAMKMEMSRERSFIYRPMKSCSRTCELLLVVKWKQ